MRVITTPHGTGAPTNLWPLTDTEPMGFLKVTMGAAFTKGIYTGACARLQSSGKRQLCYCKLHTQYGTCSFTCSRHFFHYTHMLKPTCHHACAATCQLLSQACQLTNMPLTMRPNSAPSQWMKKRSSSYPVSARICSTRSRSSTAPRTWKQTTTDMNNKLHFLAAKLGKPALGVLISLLAARCLHCCWSAAAQPRASATTDCQQ